ncbi:MAG: hypothetical protein ACR2NM_04525 [Bythopirellula sp.]
MQLIILHYHLNRGGVTSVVENHLRSLASLCGDARPDRVVVLYGGRAQAWNPELAGELPFACELCEVPELEYDNHRPADGDLQAALEKVLSQFDRDSTILHIHNHSLGKNAAMAGVACQLADEGWRLLLQIHDFAEDLRPTNYQHLLSSAESVSELQSQLYPQAAQVHYVSLNRRDERVLVQAGIAVQHVHLLPNPVLDFPSPCDAEQLDTARAELANALELPPGQRFVLYPVRPIRRKNIGELLLWSMLVDDTTFALTLKPLNPQEDAAYQRWVQLAADLQLPVKFEIASTTDLPFEAVYAAADAIITTSVTEGFGMVYLEASLTGKQLVGRSLPGISDDFVSSGMQFPGLTETMSIPVELIDLSELKSYYAQQIKSLRNAYHLQDEGPADVAAIDASFSGETVDFARLTVGQQWGLLKRLKTDATLRESLRHLNPVVGKLDQFSDDELATTLVNNRRVIAEHYSPAVVGEQLREIYQTLLSSVPGNVTRGPGIARAILERFVHPSRLFPIRLES